MKLVRAFSEIDLSPEEDLGVPVAELLLGHAVGHLDLVHDGMGCSNVLFLVRHRALHLLRHSKGLKETG